MAVSADSLVVVWVRRLRLMRVYGPALDVFFLPMYFCYLDESGTPEPLANTTHFVLLGIAIPAATWHAKDAAIEEIKQRHRISGKEIHTAFMARRFPEQERIAGFTTMTDAQRRDAMRVAREAELLRVLAVYGPKRLKTVKATFKKTEDYVHLTMAERVQVLRDTADVVGSWGDSRLFAEAYDKRAYTPARPVLDISFEQVVTRFHTFLVNQEQRGPTGGGASNMGVLIEDNNQTVEKRITALMRRFHQQGTVWRRIERIIETPLFVDSSLTSMVQVADLCAYATRRFFEHGETDLLERVYSRFDRRGAWLVGLRHYTGPTACHCRICQHHGRGT